MYFRRSSLETLKGGIEDGLCPVAERLTVAIEKKGVNSGGLVLAAIDEVRNKFGFSLRFQLICISVEPIPTRLGNFRRYIMRE